MGGKHDPVGEKCLKIKNAEGAFHMRPHWVQAAPLPAKSGERLFLRKNKPVAAYLNTASGLFLFFTRCSNLLNFRYTG